jgi:hypothetical protein
MPETINKTIPVLRIFDEARAREFYLDFLGFKIDWDRFEQNAPLYMQMTRGNLVLHLTEHYGDCLPGSNATKRRLSLRES